MLNNQVVDELSSLLDRVLDGTTGLLKFVSITEVQADEPPLFVGMAEMIDARKVEPARMDKVYWQDKAKLILDDASEHLKVPSGTIHSSGAGLDRTKALWATVGEALERYAMGYYHPTDSILATADQLPERALDPDDLILFSQDQYADENFMYAKYQASQPRHWLPGVSLTDGKAKFVPADLVIGTNLKDAPEKRLDGTYSTGCAAGPNYEWALLSGLSEAIERDAFMYYWLTARKPQKLDLNLLKPYLPKKLQDLIAFPHVDVYVRWLKTDVNIPTVACFIKPKNAKGFATGASTNVDWRVALEKAVVESFHTLNWTVDLDRWDEGPQQKERILDFPQHVRYYLEPENHKNVEFLVADDADDGTAAFLKAYEGQIKSLKEVVEHIKHNGYEVLAVDRTYDDIDSLGLKVAHIIIPGFHPLHVGLGIEHRDTRRLDKLSRDFGLPHVESLNLNPHPFP